MARPDRRFFGLITDERIRRGNFTSAKNFEKAIHDCIGHLTNDPKPFVWTATPDEI